MSPTKRRDISLRLQAVNPHPTSELVHKTPFELLVAAIISAQTTDKCVNTAPGKDALIAKKNLLKFVPKELKFGAHHWLILHRRHVCTARKPKCGECIINNLCEFKEKML